MGDVGHWRGVRQLEWNALPGRRIFHHTPPTRVSSPPHTRPTNMHAGFEPHRRSTSSPSRISTSLLCYIYKCFSSHLMDPQKRGGKLLHVRRQNFDSSHARPVSTCLPTLLADRLKSRIPPHAFWLNLEPHETYCQEASQRIPPLPVGHCAYTYPWIHLQAVSKHAEP
jgi:hypothetical protein